MGQELQCVYVHSLKQRRDPHLVTPVLPELDSPHHLLVDEICSHRVLCGLMPWSKDLLPEEQPPWGIPLLGSLLLGILLTLGNSVHHMVSTTAQG